jgi:hypothetical protein
MVRFRGIPAIVAALGLLAISATVAAEVGYTKSTSSFEIYSSMIAVESANDQPSISLYVVTPDGRALLLGIRLAEVIALSDLNGDRHYQPGEEGDRIVAKQWTLTGPASERTPQGNVVTVSFASNLDLLRVGPLGPARDFAQVSLALSLADHERMIGGSSVAAEREVKLDLSLTVRTPGLVKGLAIKLALSEAPGGEIDRAVLVPGVAGPVSLRSGTSSSPLNVPWMQDHTSVSFATDSGQEHAYLEWRGTTDGSDPVEVRASSWSNGANVNLALAYPIGAAALTISHDPVIGVKLESKLVQDLSKGLADTVANNLPAFAGGMIAAAALIVSVMARTARRRAAYVRPESHPRWRGVSRVPARAIAPKPPQSGRGPGP